MTLPFQYAASGGTLDSDDPSYIARQADHDLYEALQRGDYCYVLNSRQVGKSSLIVRTARRLRQEQIQVAVLELTKLGSSNTSAEKWYRSLLDPIGRQLGKRAELVAFWRDHEELDALYRWMQALQQVVLSGSESVVICLDEIDSVQALPFSVDEFFAAIRECFNARTQEPDLHRLTFCLVGVLTPSELIKNPLITPFNIGRRIDLTDLTLEEMKPLAQGLGREEPLAHELLARIWYWTNGHPYLTQVLCEKVAQDATVTRPAGVDRLCEESFLSSRAREKETNLQHVRTLILRKDLDQAAVLDLYRQVRRRKRIKDDDTHPIINALRLAGLIRVVDDYLWVRNRIYFRAFDEDWILANMPDAEKRRQEAARRRGFWQATGIAAVVIAGISASVYWYFDSYVWEHVAYCNTYAKRFGIMECVGELTKEQAQGRATSFKFIRTGRYRPVQKVQIVNSVGECNPRHSEGTYLKQPSWEEQQNPLRECQWEFVTDANGNIVYEKSFNKENRLVWGLVYSPPLEGQTHPTRAHFVGPNGFPQPQTNSKAKFVKFEYSDKGDEIARYYVDDDDKPQLGLDKAFGRSQKFDEDERGLVIEMTSLDAEGKPMNDEAGNATAELIYDEMGNVTKLTAFDAQGLPILVKDGWHKAIQEFDARGNQIELAYFGTDGQPILLKDGNHKWTAQYDVRGNRIEEAYFDVEGKPIARKDLGFHKFVWKYDERGNKTEEAYFGTDGQPILLKGGYHKWVSQYDELGNVIDEQLFDVKGQLVESKAVPMNQRADSPNLWQILAKTLALGPKQVTVVSILPASQAEQLGIQAGDILTEYDGNLILDTALFIFNRNSEPADGPAKELKILRDGKELTFMVKPGKIGVELTDQVK